MPVYVTIFRQVHRLQRPLRWGSFRHTSPLSKVFGFDRGLPVDRYYIEAFLQMYRSDIRWMVLEIGDPEYTLKFGGDQVVRSDVLHAVPGNPKATMVGDLETGQGLPSNAYDCIILTQTLPFIFNIKAALITCYTALKPSGVLLATLPGISQISRYDMDRWGDYWRFTDLSVRKLFTEVFIGEQVLVETHGNVLAACALLQGIVAEELTPGELDACDPDYQVTITVRAQKAG